MEISDVAITVVFADASVESEREQTYKALVSTLADRDVVLVWQDASGKTKFIAPVQQHRFFEAMRYDQLIVQANGTVALTQS